MRRFGWLLMSVGMLACGGAPERTAMPAPIAAAAATPPPISAEVIPPESGRLPDNAAAYASLDVAAVDQWLGHIAKIMPPEAIARLERNLGLLPGAMGAGSLLQSSGVDAQRPIVAAVSPLNVDGRTVLSIGVEQFAALAARGFLPNGLALTMNKALKAHREPPIHLRIVIPTKDSAAMVTAIRSFLFELECDATDVPDGFSEVCFHGNKSLAFSVRPNEVVMDFHRFVGATPSKTDFVEALLRTRRAMSEAHGGVAPSLESSAVRVRYNPGSLADVGYVDAIGEAYGSGERDARSADWSMLALLRSAGLVTSLGKRVDGAHFEAVDVRIGFHDALPELRVEAFYGPGLKPPTSAACAPSRSVDFPGALSRFDLNTSCMRALEVPGDTEHGPLTQSTFLRMFRDAHWVGQPVALPWYPIGLTRTPLHWYAGVGPEAMMRFERFGWSNPAFGEPDVFWGLLPAGATTLDVRCAVAESPASCQGKRQIVVGRINDVGRAFVRVVKLGDRVVVLSSLNRQAVGAMTPKLTADSVPPFRAAVSKGTMQRELKERGMNGPETRYVGRVEVLGDRLVWVARPAD